ncbi:MAG: DUF975 family protein [Lachnospiraceae bacterium]|nr:DUF975 family protein [Lachnospiraceae bacterium]
MKDTKTLKWDARKRLSGKYGTASGIIGIYLLCRSLTSLLVTQIFADSLLMFIMWQLIAFCTDLFIELVHAGVCKCFLDVAYGSYPTSSDLFFCLRRGVVKRFIVPAAILSSVSFICALPANLIAFYMDGHQVKDYMLVFSVMGIGFLVASVIRIVYSQMYYIGMDLPDKAGTELLKMSSWLMKGNWGKYLYMVLSFLPLLFLCITSLGIGIFWVLPYVETTKGAFYLSLTESKMGTDMQ